MKECVRCHKIFQPDKLHPYQVHCSKTCAIKEYYVRTYVKTMRACSVCGTMFGPRGPQVVCGLRCRKINHSNKSRQWNTNHWDSFYRDYMRNYHKKRWQHYKVKHGISDVRRVKQRILIKNVLSVVGNVLLIEEASFDWLRGERRVPLKVDAYLPAHKLVIEYDGQQHFFPVQWANQSVESSRAQFVTQQQRDRQKDLLIPQHGLRFVRFAYFERIDSVDYVREKLRSAGVCI